MSTNISLGDNPGVSAFFDGQPIQDQQEAELRREEEKQDKELRRLLEAELEDFEDDEDDFLSGSNSEEDAGNESMASGQQSTRSSVDFHTQDKNQSLRLNAMNFDPVMMTQHVAEGNMSKSSSIPEGLQHQQLYHNYQQQGHQDPHLHRQLSDQNDGHGRGYGGEGQLYSSDDYLNRNHQYQQQQQQHIYGETEGFDGSVRSNMGVPHCGDHHRLMPVHNHQGKGGEFNPNLQREHSVSTGSLDRVGVSGISMTSNPESTAEDDYRDSRGNYQNDKNLQNRQDVSVRHSLDMQFLSAPTSDPNVRTNSEGKHPTSVADRYALLGLDYHQNSWMEFHGQDKALADAQECDGVPDFMSLPQVRERQPNMDINIQGRNPSDRQEGQNLAQRSKHFFHNSKNYLDKDNGDDRWMMEVQTSGIPGPSEAQPTLPHHHHHHHHQQQHQHQNLHPHYHVNDLKGVSVDSPPHPHHHHHHQFVTTSDSNAFHNSKLSHPASKLLPPSAFSPVSPTRHPHYHPQQQQEQRQQQQQQQQTAHQRVQESTDSPPPLPSTLPPPLPLSPSGPSVPSIETQYKVVHESQPPTSVKGDDDYKVVYKKQRGATKGEEEFYLTDDQTQFFQKHGPEEKLRFEQLEILYRARGREIEELKRKLEDQVEEAGKEKRALKHRAAVAEGEANGTSESLKQSQRLFHQAKGDHSEALGKITALEKELSAAREAKEELIQKLREAETTIETLNQHVSELSESDSVSRARREHEAVVSSLTQRHQRELLVIREQLDIARTDLASKTEDLTQVRGQLGEATQALEQAQVSRGETVNRLSRSLEESQRRCQELLGQLGTDGAAREVATLRVKLEQSQESTRYSEELCRTYQGEVKELKEQLSMLEAATSLGAFSALSSTTTATTVAATGGGGRAAAAAAQSADDSMTDLGIRRTLDFSSSTPQSAARSEEVKTPSADDDLASSLRSELERCLRSNKEKRAEVNELRAQVKDLTSKLEEAKAWVEELEKQWSGQKKRLDELEELTGGEEGGVSAVEARLKRDLDKMTREKQALLDDIKDYQQRLEEIGASEAQLTEINAELSNQMSAMVSTSDQDKADALASYQRTMEETSRISLDRLRKEMEERHRSEVEVTAGQAEKQISNLKQQLTSALTDLDNVKALYVNTCQESSAQQAELTDKFTRQLEAETQKIEDRVELEKKEWREFIREEIRKEEKETERAAETEKMKKLEEQLREEWEKETQLKISEATLQALQKEKEAVSEEKQDWEKKQAELEAALRDKAKEVSDLNVELEDAKLQMNVLREKIKEMERKEGETIGEQEGASLRKSSEILTVETGTESVHDEGSDAVSSTSLKMVEGQVGSANITQETHTQAEALDQQVDVSNNACVMSDKDEEFVKLSEKVVKKEEEIGELNKTLSDKVKELEEKGRELDELRQKGREAAELLDQKGEEIKGLQKRLREEAERMEEEVAGWRRKVEGLEEEVATLMGEGRGRKEDSKDVSEGDVGNSLEGQGNDLENLTVADLQVAVTSLRERLKVTVRSHHEDLEKQKEQHRGEVERAARQREEKFQSELRYFLREREEKGKTRMEEALKLEQEKARKEFEVSLREVRRAHDEEKKRLEEVYQARLRDSKVKVSEVDVVQAGKTDSGEAKSEDSSPLKDKLASAVEELRMERSGTEEKLKQIREEHDGQMVSLALRHEAEEKSAREKHEREMSELKETHKSDIDKMQVELDEMKKKFENELKEAESAIRAKVSVDTLRMETEIERKVEKQIRKEVEGKIRREVEREMAQRVKEEVEKGRSNLNVVDGEVEKKVGEKLQEERSKWLKDAEEYIKEEVRKGVDNGVKEGEETHRKEFERKVEEEVRSRLKEDGDTAKKDIEVQIEAELKERVKKEQTKLRKEAEEQLNDRIQKEVENLKQKFSTELNARISREKSRLEKEVAAWKMEARSRMEKDRGERAKETEAEKERWMKEKAAHMEKKVSEERKRVERELRKARDKEVQELRRELEEEMRRRIVREKEEWEIDVREERKKSKDRGKVDGADEEGRDNMRDVYSVEEKLKSEIEARTKACAERDKAVAFIRQREASYKEERQRLVAGLERCRSDLQAMKGEHQELEEKYTSMDRRYKEDMRDARRRRDEDCKELRNAMEQEKQKAVRVLEDKVRRLQQEKGSLLEGASLVSRAQRQAEGVIGMGDPAQVSDADGNTILELRDHYIETVAKIKADVMAHVEEANVRAAATMRAQMRKHRVKVVEEFKVKVKASLRSTLEGQVSEQVIQSLENAVDVIVVQLLSTTPSSASSSGSSGNTPRLTKDTAESRSRATIEGKEGKDLDLEVSPHRPTAESGEAPNAELGSRSGGQALEKNVYETRVSPPSKDTDDQVRGRGDWTGAGGEREKARADRGTVGVVQRVRDSDDRLRQSPSTVPGYLAEHAALRAASPRTGVDKHHRQLDMVDLFDSSGVQPPSNSSGNSDSGGGGGLPSRSNANSKKQQQRHQNLQRHRHDLPEVPSTTATMGDNTVTPTSSNASSPRGSPTPTHPYNRRTQSGTKAALGSETEAMRPGLEHTPFVTRRRGGGDDDDEWEAERSFSNKLNRETNRRTPIPADEATTSPRDQMKVVEARVRLAHWARSGEAPWSPSALVAAASPNFLSDGGGGSISGDSVDGSSGKGRKREEQSPVLWKGEREKAFEEKEDGVSKDGFRVPGVEAEKWIRTQKRNAVGQKSRPQGFNAEEEGQSQFAGDSKANFRDDFDSKHKGKLREDKEDHRSGHVRYGDGAPGLERHKALAAEDQLLSSDESVASSTPSLVTLQPEGSNVGGKDYDSWMTGQDSRTFTFQQDGRSSEYAQVLSKTRGQRKDRQVGGRAEYGHTLGKDGEGGEEKDYERIRAAIFRGGGGGGVRDLIDFGKARDNRPLSSSSDDERSDEVVTIPARRRARMANSADRERRPRGNAGERPTSTPLVKHIGGENGRPWSESRIATRSGFKDHTGHRMNGVGTKSQDWKHLGGQDFFETDGKFASKEGRRPSPQKSGSLPQHSRRGSRSGRHGDDDLVLRSADHISTIAASTGFPSDLSRITQESGRDLVEREPGVGRGMWRYHSLEDLIAGGGGEGQAGRRDAQKWRVFDNIDSDDFEEEERDVRVERHIQRRQGGRSKEVRGGGGGREEEYSSSDFLRTRRRREGAPVQAMNSEFWERHEVNGEDMHEVKDESELDRRAAKQKRGGSKMQRSTSEQSLNTLHGKESLADRLSSGGDGIDSLLAHYLSPTHSSFDLRPFSREEHF